MTWFDSISLLYIVQRICGFICACDRAIRIVMLSLTMEEEEEDVL